MRRLLLLALVSITIPPGAADAKTSVVDNRQYVLVEGSDQADRLTISAAEDDSHVLFSDPDGITGCEPVDATTVRCAAHVCCKYLAVHLRGGDDLLQVGDGMTLDVVARGMDGDDTMLGGQFREQFQGGPGSDHLTGGSGADQLEGGEGNDVMDGGIGADKLYGGDGLDVATYAGRPEGVRVWLDYRAGYAFGAEDPNVDAEVVEGGEGPDVIIGSAGDDVIRGNGGDDRLSGGDGHDVVEGGGGDDLMLGDGLGVENPPADPEAAGASDALDGGPGADTIRGDAGRDVVNGGDGDDIVDAREFRPTPEPQDETPDCGSGDDVALLDHNDRAGECERIHRREYQPDDPAQPQAELPLVPQGPGSQPQLGVPTSRSGIVFAPVRCLGPARCRADLAIRGGGGTAVIGRAHLLLRPGTLRSVPIHVAPRARRAIRRRGVLRAIVELRMTRRRWVRPVWIRR
jgi:Ca2+-binding RTX toxin-like protein